MQTMAYYVQLSSQGTRATGRIDRRTVVLSFLVSVVSSHEAVAQRAEIADAVPAGCAFFFQAAESSQLRKKDESQFPGLRRIGGENSSNGLAAVGIEFARIFDLNVGMALYNDASSGVQGNAGAIPSSISDFPGSEGVVVLGDKCLRFLESHEFSSAARSAICAHEVGHVLQAKYVGSELNQLRILDGGVVRTELHADFVCGYYASVRKRVQPDFPAVISAVTQFRFGANDLANPWHHGTPAERGAAVQAGFEFGLGGYQTSQSIARVALAYVKSIRPTSLR